MKIAVVNGPNLNKLGVREKGIYGEESWEEVAKKVKDLAANLKLEVEFFQSNHEGELIDYLQGVKADGLIVNLGGYSHTSVALRDALILCGLPAVEVHITNIFRREEFRKHSLIADVALGVIAGLGGEGYLLAMVALARLLEKTPAS
jgi:3-dehydroquinate dehydratase-2